MTRVEIIGEPHLLAEGSTDQANIIMRESCVEFIPFHASELFTDNPDRVGKCNSPCESLPALESGTMVIFYQRPAFFRNVIDSVSIIVSILLLIRAHQTIEQTAVPIW